LKRPIKGIVWKRPNEFATNPQLFVDEAHPGDIIQGRLGDCWLLGALSAVATRIDLIKKIVIAYHPECGFARFRFFKNGEWHVVTVDDRIPCVSAGSTWAPFASSCRDTNEMWVPLMEKAFAKLHGSYGSLIGGNTNEGFVDLTGGFSETFEVRKDDKSLWKIISNSINQRWLLGCACTGGAKDTGMGILTGHAYTILRALKFQGEKLIQFRNPWGRKEWTGKWGDYDTARWTKGARKELSKPKSADDGTFWMSFVDFIKQFNKLYVCRLYEGDFGFKLTKYIAKSAWSGKRAGGNPNFSTWKNNPQFCLSLKKACEVIIVLTQEDERMKSCNHNPYAIGISVYRKDNVTRMETTDNRRLVSEPEAYSSQREAICEFKRLSAGNYVVVPSTFYPKEKGLFWLTILSSQPIEVFRFI
jgi:calpain